jgi:hypothetical protein
MSIPFLVGMYKNYSTGGTEYKTATTWATSFGISSPANAYDGTAPSYNSSTSATQSSIGAFAEFWMGLAASMSELNILGTWESRVQTYSTPPTLYIDFTMSVSTYSNLNVTDGSVANASVEYTVDGTNWYSADFLDGYMYNGTQTTDYHTTPFSVVLTGLTTPYNLTNVKIRLYTNGGGGYSDPGQDPNADYARGSASVSLYRVWTQATY